MLHKLKIIYFLPSYVGSKRYWLKILSRRYKGQSFVEPFCGSAVISANYAGKAILNDNDPYIYRILKYFDQLIVPELFTKVDYYRVRKQEDWWKYAFCLQKMSFSGVFRYSKNGYNVPLKKKYVEEARLKKPYAQALARWKELKPDVRDGDYRSIEDEDIKGKIVVLDPPYHASAASYSQRPFDRKEYWKYVKRVQKKCATLIIFDRQDAFQSQSIPVYRSRSMRVNGKYGSGMESLAIYEKGRWKSPDSGYDIFAGK